MILDTLICLSLLQHYEASIPGKASFHLLLSFAVTFKAFRVILGHVALSHDYHSACQAP